MTQTHQHINLDYLSLMSDGDRDMVQTMLEMLLVELPDELGQMKLLHRAGNWADLHRVSHKMKSTLAFVGNEELTAANRQIELSSKQLSDLDQISGLLLEMEALFPQIMEALKAATEQ